MTWLCGPRLHELKALPFCIVYALPLSVLKGYELGDWGTFLTPIIVFGVVPVLDLLLGVNRRNPRSEDEAALAGTRIFRIITWLCVPIQVAIVIWGARLAGSGTLTPLEALGVTLSIGLGSGILGINVAHELIHRPGRFERTLGRILLWTTSYLHWAVEHVHGHHRTVGTSRDPATSRLGESFYRFWLRAVAGTVRSAWGIEVRRLRRRRLPLWSPRNQILWAFLLPASLALGLGVAFGLGAALFFAAQSVVGFSLLEAVNYLEHYGLERRPAGEGKWERVTPLHSWNASNWLTNYFLFHLQRHSDHHAYPRRRYQILRHFGESPQLPTGYAGMVLVALIPPLWFRVMDPRARAHRARLQGLAGHSEAA